MVSCRDSICHEKSISILKYKIGEPLSFYNIPTLKPHSQPPPSFPLLAVSLFVCPHVIKSSLYLWHFSCEKFLPRSPLSFRSFWCTYTTQWNACSIVKQNFRSNPAKFSSSNRDLYSSRTRCCRVVKQNFVRQTFWITQYVQKWMECNQH